MYLISVILRTGPLDIECDKVEAFYAAYRKLVQIINNEPDLHFWLRPEEGNLVSFDNRRILHARTQFSNGNRHLQVLPLLVPPLETCLTWVHRYWE